MSRRGSGFRERRGGFGNRGRGGFNRSFDTGPPSTVKELGYFSHTCEDDIVCKVVIEDVPYFNAPIYLENKQQIGKVDEILGPVRDYYISVKLAEDVKANSLSEKQKIYIDPAKLLPLVRVISGTSSGRGRGGGGRVGRGGRGGFGGRGGGGRGGGRGSFGRGGGRGGFGRGGGFNDRRGGGFNDRRGGGFNDRRSGGFNDRRSGGFNDRRGGFNNDQGGFKRSFDGNNSSTQEKRVKHY